MNPLEASWTILKGGHSTIDLIARESNSMEEALQSMQESFPNIDKEQAMKYITEAKSNHAREGPLNRYSSNEKDPAGDGPLNRYSSNEQDPTMKPNNPSENNQMQTYDGGESEQEPNPLDLGIDRLKDSLKEE
tara:strand:+ start:218 stop:616 length:399 start_codon:yes stop_codon:yes gene_type:complete